MEDTIIAELRKIRDEHAAKFSYDLDAMVEDWRKIERKHKHKLVNRKPRKVSSK